jgi:hypothetical protein
MVGQPPRLHWFLLRRGDPETATAALRRARPWLIALAAALWAAGLGVFVLADEDLGLLLVVLGGAALAVNLLGVKQDSPASPTDGPLYCDTPPYGG